MELVRQSNEKARVQVTVDSAGIKEQINIPEAAVENTDDMAKKVSKGRKSPEKKSASKSSSAKQAAVKAEIIAADFPADMTNNDRIIELSKRGVSNKDIAKLLNIGIGEVKLVVDLFNSSK